MNRNKLPPGWEWRNLGGVNGFKAACQFLDNFRSPVNGNERAKRPGPYQYYGANGQQGWIDGYLFDEELVLLAEDGGFFFDSIKPASYRVSGKCWVNNHAHVLRPLNDVDADWLHFTLSFADYSSFIPEPIRPKLNQKNAKLIEVPIPPLSEQKRIVVRIKNQTSRSEEIKQRLLEMEEDLNGTLRGVYADIIKDVEYHPMSEVAPLVRRSIKVELSAQYPELGIRSFGKGTFHKPALTGKELGSKRIFTIEVGDLLFNIVFAWEGAVAIAKHEDNGRVGSHRFLTCVPQKGIATSAFLCFHFLTEKGLHDLGDASPGGAGRNRTLGLKSLDRIKVPVPPYEKQVWFSRLWEKANAARQLQNEISSDLAAFTPALLAKAFRGEL